MSFYRVPDVITHWIYYFSGGNHLAVFQNEQHVFV